ncbi:MAG: prolyl oligopeptidase family serine peptidase [Tissierellia bacterium]|nr:prolyl oligopeptidase family serine peptidase [Tissierellia bacterium]
MTDYIKSSFIIEEEIRIKGIPAIIFRPRGAKELPSIIFYHGWGSDKNTQRIRGFILAAAGYQVVIPDAVYHGERNPLADYSMAAVKEYFWDIIFSNMEEYSTIEKELILKYNTEPDRIAVMGNSMGGFTAAGIFTHNKNIKALTVFNCSCSWESFNKQNFQIDMTEKLERLTRKAVEMDPYNHIGMLKDRPILMLHGDSDTLVPVEGQRDFYDKFYTIYQEKEKIKLVEYPGLNHFVTTNMMEESINWLGRYL